MSLRARLLIDGYQVRDDFLPSLDKIAGKTLQLVCDSLLGGAQSSNVSTRIYGSNESESDSDGHFQRV